MGDSQLEASGICALHSSERFVNAILMTYNRDEVVGGNHGFIYDFLVRHFL